MDVDDSKTISLEEFTAYYKPKWDILEGSDPIEEPRIEDQPRAMPLEFPRRLSGDDVQTNGNDVKAEGDGVDVVSVHEFQEYEVFCPSPVPDLHTHRLSKTPTQCRSPWQSSPVGNMEFQTVYTTSLYNVEVKNLSLQLSLSSLAFIRMNAFDSAIHCS